MQAPLLLQYSPEGQLSLAGSSAAVQATQSFDLLKLGFLKQIGVIPLQLASVRHSSQSEPFRASQKVFPLTPEHELGTVVHSHSLVPVLQKLSPSGAPEVQSPLLVQAV